MLHYKHMLKPLRSRPDIGRYQWEFECKCGNICTAYWYTVQYGQKTMCSDCQSVKRRKRATKHGGKNTRLYNIWVGMRQRCNNPKIPSWQWYGAKGIRVCKRWGSFENFRQDMIEGYSDDLTLDRKNPKKGYCKQNCRWADNLTQGRNKDKVKSYQGKTLTQWSQELGGGREIVTKRVRSGWPIEKACTTPVIKSKRTKAAKEKYGEPDTYK